MNLPHTNTCIHGTFYKNDCPTCKKFQTMSDTKKATTPADPADPEHSHYEWGASGAKQWRGCPGSIALTHEKKAEGKIPDDNDTEWSREGTEAHDYADKFLKGEIHKDEIPANFWEHLEGYIDLATELAECEDAENVFTEQQVPYFYNLDKTGTLDYAVVSDTEVAILDLKYGAGVYVTASENDQLAIYALSLMQKLRGEGFHFEDDTIVKMHIYQPRHRSFDGVGEVWTTTYRDLLDFSIDIEADYKKSKVASSDDLNPSVDVCRFCDARRCCPTRVLDMFDGIPDEANPLTGEVDLVAAKGEITDEVRVRIFEKHKAISKFFTELMDDTLALIEQSKLSVDGLKTIDGGKGNRQWGENMAEADKLLRKLPASDRYAPKKLISPAQAEKVLKKAGTPVESQSTRFQNRWNQLVFQKDGSPTLVLASDPRPARQSVIDQFDDESEVSAEDCF